MVYKHVFFDLDRTLWDFEKNCSEALSELAVKYNLQAYGIDCQDTFIAHFIQVNEQLWENYGKGLITREQIRNDRFYQTFLRYKLINDQLTRAIGKDYTAIAPTKKNLLPDATTVLTYLKKKYTLHILTNGFEETQLVKLEQCGLTGYFSEIITSERAGFKKPDAGIFNFSLNLTKAEAGCSIMIGDSLHTDIMGAREAGIHQVYLNREEKKHAEMVTYEITALKQLMNIL